MLFSRVLSRVELSRVECVEGEVLPISGPAMGGGGALSATVQSPGPGTLDLYKFSPFFPPHVPFFIPFLGLCR